MAHKDPSLRDTPPEMPWRPLPVFPLDSGDILPTLSSLLLLQIQQSKHALDNVLAGVFNGIHLDPVWSEFLCGLAGQSFQPVHAGDECRSVLPSRGGRADEI